MFNVCGDPCSGNDAAEIESVDVEAEGEFREATVIDDAFEDVSYDKHPILRESPSVNGSVRFVLASALRQLPNPWPRSQDLDEEVIKLPLADDFVIAISHSWPYQRHPDPLSIEKLADLVDEVIEKVSSSKPLGDFLVFYDFMSVPQVPFAAGQAPRSDEENAKVGLALKATPSIYMFADAVVHINLDWTAVPGDGIEIVLTSTNLEAARFWERNGQVQIEQNDASTGASDATPFDIVLDLDGVPVTSSKVLEDCIEQGVTKGVRVRKAPFGEQNKVPCEDRGWIFFERFLAMVTVAMVSADEAKRMQHSNSEEVLKEVLDGGEILRGAAQRGSLKLHEELARFNDILNTKKFYVSSDRDLVLKLMQDAVKSLPHQWKVHALTAADRRATVNNYLQSSPNGNRQSLLAALDTEIGDGKSYIDECPISGEVQRVVVVVALRCTDLSRKILVHLARWDNLVVTPDIKLPGTKLHEGEDLSLAMQRLLCEELQPISHCIKVQNPTLEVEWRESKKIKGIITKYVKNEYQASIDPHMAFPLLAETRRVQTAVSNETLPQVLNVRSSAVPVNGPPSHESFKYLSIKLLAYADKMMLYAWLDEADFDHLKSEAGRNDLKNLVKGLCVDEIAEQHAKSIWAECENERQHHERRLSDATVKSASLKVGVVQESMALGSFKHKGSVPA